MSSRRNTVFVANIAMSVSPGEVEAALSQAGEVASVQFTTTASGKHRGFGYIDFTTREAAVAATELEGLELGGKPIRIDLCEK
ncbi:uncharacterized protein AMSG_07992 [Thecamonas trahens ATCC 50062]|uniref:RRM domain-containing protein n=1 Tax=Thecamonas trahens ATCC 50062 TaxID=461836 RepID=A0A0L0DKJ5_THETB|nr:hypothetical protein AMSG_07992 [Thecamonas trahens ATCC 50062]KNC51893.1 hypothetical protein AMSG_07992 [Thecamonas trahens ATCC 50062]|eukprot:XP_013755750.1 hypothetical protein AMSG_07992 [Thecamonas trahens ATCC 50062]